MRCDVLEFCSNDCSKMCRSGEAEEIDRLAGCDRWRFQPGVGQVRVSGDDVVGSDGSGEEEYVVVLGVAKFGDSGLGVRLDSEESAQFLDEFVDFGQRQESSKAVASEDVSEFGEEER